MKKKTFQDRCHFFPFFSFLAHSFPNNDSSFVCFDFREQRAPPRRRRHSARAAGAPGVRGVAEFRRRRNLEEARREEEGRCGRQSSSSSGFGFGLCERRRDRRRGEASSRRSSGTRGRGERESMERKEKETFFFSRLQCYFFRRRSIRSRRTTMA